jgi:SAM-dependent methyltransferase
MGRPVLDGPMTRVHSVAKNFDSAAEVYERSRPDYPPAAVEFLQAEFRVGPGIRVVDVGAGTGKLSRALRPTGAEITAVEPLPRMRDVFRREIPDVRVLDASAESLPFPKASVDLIVAGQAFHWFRGPSAVREIARVLRPRGGLALLWNTRDESVPWVRRFTEILEPYRSDAPGYRSEAWRKAFHGSIFTPLRHRVFPFVHLQPRDSMADRALSVSFIAGLPDAEKAQVARRVLRMLDEDPTTRTSDPIEFPYRTDVYFARKK